MVRMVIALTLNLAVITFPSGVNVLSQQKDSKEAPLPIADSLTAITTEATALFERESQRTMFRPATTRALDWISPGSLARLGIETQRFLLDRLIRPELAAMK